jgi:CheY-like chemotaxis protein
MILPGCTPEASDFEITAVSVAWSELQSLPMKPRRSDVGKANRKPPRKLRILIANVAEVGRRAVRHLLGSPGLDICGEATDGVEAVEKAEALKPDVVIVDLAMPRLSGPDATRRILERNPLQRVLLLAAHGSAKAVRECQGPARGDSSRNRIRLRT